MGRETRRCAFPLDGHFHLGKFLGKRFGTPDGEEGPDRGLRAERKEDLFRVEDTRVAFQVERRDLLHRHRHLDLLDRDILDLVITHGALGGVPQKLKDRRLRRVVITVNSRRVVYDRFFPLTHRQREFQRAVRAGCDGRNIQRSPALFRSDERVERVPQGGVREARVQARQGQCHGNTARPFLHPQDRRRYGESYFREGQVRGAEAAPFRFVSGQFPTRAVRRVGDGRVMDGAMTVRIQKDGAERLYLGDVDDRFARRRVDQFHAGLVFPRGENIFGRNDDRR